MSANDPAGRAGSAASARPAATAQLDGAARDTCRRLVRQQLDRAAAACERLADPGDAEALHDFRVALRRLRGTLRAFPKPLAGAVGGKWARRLGDLAAATGDGRDAEVALAWVEGQRPHLNWRQRRGLRWYADRLARAKDAAYGEVLETVPGRFAKLAERLARRLEDPPAAAPVVEPSADETPETAPPAIGDVDTAEAAWTSETATGEPKIVGAEDDPRVDLPKTLLPPAEALHPPASEEPFALLLAAAAREAASRLVDRLGKIRAAGDERAAHRARIAAKRLRYILEPAAATVAEARTAVRALKSLQDLLGDLHDAHVLERELAATVDHAARWRARDLLGAAVDAEGEGAPEVATAGAGRWDVVGGLVALAARNRDRRDRLFAELAGEWLAGPKTADLAAAVGGLAARLEATAAVAAASEALRAAP